MRAAFRQIWFDRIENGRQARRIMLTCAASFVVTFLCTYALVLALLAIWGPRRSTSSSPAWLAGLEWVVLLGAPAWLALGCSRIAALLVLVGSAALTLFVLFATTVQTVRADPETYRDLPFTGLRVAWVLTSVLSLSTLLVSWRAVRAAFAYRRLNAETGPSGIADAFG